MENIDLDNSSLLSDRLIYTGESDTPTHLHLCTYNAQGGLQKSEFELRLIVKILTEAGMHGIRLFMFGVNISLMEI